MAVGRPTKYLSKYCTMIEKHLSDGFTLESFAGQIGVNVDTIHEWAKCYSEFSDAKTRGIAEGQKRMEKIGVDGMNGKIKGFNAAAWIFWMKNRYRWRDRQELDHTSSDKSMSPAKIDLSKLSQAELDALEKIQSKLENDPSKS